MYFSLLMGLAYGVPTLALMSAGEARLVELLERRRIRVGRLATLLVSSLRDG
jgi:hypothetical protein